MFMFEIINKQQKKKKEKKENRKKERKEGTAIFVIYFVVYFKGDTRVTQQVQFSNPIFFHSIFYLILVVT